MTTKLFIHPGFVKSATTALQAHLFNSHPNLLNIGKPYYRDGKPDRLEAHAFIDYVRQEPHLSYDTDTATRMFSDCAGADFEHAAVASLSDERLTNTSGTDRTLAAVRLRDTVGEAGIIFVIRRQIDMLKAIYTMQFVGREISITFDQWMEVHFRHLLGNSVTMANYYEWISAYAEIFGRQNVGIFLYEDLVADSRSFVKQITDFMGLNSSASVPLAEGRSERGRSSGLSYLAARHPAVDAANQTARAVLPGGLYDGIKNIMRRGGRAEPDLDVKWQTELNDYVRTGNQRLVEEYGLDLKKYGYAL